MVLTMDFNLIFVESTDGKPPLKNHFSLKLEGVQQHTLKTWSFSNILVIRHDKTRIFAASSWIAYERLASGM